METKEKKSIDGEDFGRIMTVMKNSHASIPLEYILSILGGIVKDSDKDSEHVKEFAKVVKDRSTEEIISSSVLHTCNSLVIDIWRIFGSKLEELAEFNGNEPVQTDNKEA